MKTLKATTATKKRQKALVKRLILNINLQHIDKSKAMQLQVGLTASRKH